jgi:hypothetical protein
LKNEDVGMRSAAIAEGHWHLQSGSPIWQ